MQISRWSIWSTPDWWRSADRARSPPQRRRRHREAGPVGDLLGGWNAAAHQPIPAGPGVLDGTRLWLRFVGDDELASRYGIEHVTRRSRRSCASGGRRTPAWAARVAMTLVSVGVLAALGLLVRWRNQLMTTGWRPRWRHRGGCRAARDGHPAAPGYRRRPGPTGREPGRTFRLVADVLRLNGIAALAVAALGAAVPGPVGAPRSLCRLRSFSPPQL